MVGAGGVLVELIKDVAVALAPLSAETAEHMLKRLRVWPARAGDTLGRMLARGGAAWNAEQASVANGIAADARIEPGWPVKMAVSERYRGTTAPAPAAK